MRPYRLKIQAGKTIELGVTGNYVRIADSLVSVTIETIDYQNMVTLTEGEEVTLAPFNGLRISHADVIEQEILIYVASGAKIGSSKVAGAVSITGEQGAFTQSRASLSNVAATLLAANADRRYLMIQNNDAAAVMRLSLDGVAPTVAEGFRIGPGDSIDLSGFMVSGEIKAIMETATAAAANVEIVEG